jgi:hypothetical protein
LAGTKLPAAALVGLVLLAAPASANHSVFAFVSAGLAKGNGPVDVSVFAASATGNRVFLTTAEQLTSDDTDASVDLYERAGGATTRLSQGEQNGNGAFSASFVGASGDGSHVFFVTTEQLTADDFDGSSDLFERAGETTTRLSKGLGFGSGGGAFDAFFAGASSDGSHVFFRTAEQLTGDDTDTQFDIYERVGGATTRLSQGAVNGNDAFDASFAGASSDGSQSRLLRHERAADRRRHRRPARRLPARDRDDDQTLQGGRQRQRRVHRRLPRRLGRRSS